MRTKVEIIGVVPSSGIAAAAAVLPKSTGIRLEVYGRVPRVPADKVGVAPLRDHAALGHASLAGENDVLLDVSNMDQHSERQELDAALNRAIWALDLARAVGDVNEANFTRWEEVAATLRTRYPKP